MVLLTLVPIWCGLQTAACWNDVNWCQVPFGGMFSKIILVELPLYDLLSLMLYSTDNDSQDINHRWRWTVNGQHIIPPPRLGTYAWNTEPCFFSNVMKAKRFKPSPFENRSSVRHEGKAESKCCLFEQINKSAHEPFAWPLLCIPLQCRGGPPQGSECERRRETAGQGASFVGCVEVDLRSAIAYAVQVETRFLVDSWMASPAPDRFTPSEEHHIPTARYKRWRSVERWLSWRREPSWHPSHNPRGCDRPGETVGTTAAQL